MNLLLGSWRQFLSQCHCREGAPALLFWAGAAAVILLQVLEQKKASCLYTSLQASRLAGNLTTANTTSENPGMFQPWHLTQVKFNLGSGCNRQEWWTCMNSEDFSSSLIVSKLLGLHSSSKCPWGVRIFRCWIRGLANIQVHSSRSEGTQI